MAKHANNAATSGGRRPYRTPSLLDYGSVAKLTQGTNSGNNDGGVAGMMTGTCL